jgi:DNA ligase-1
MKEQHAQYVSEGYEGIMLRNASSPYKHARSADLQKYKHFIDDEFKVVGFNQGEGLEAGCVIWVCATTDNKTFACRPRGTREERAMLFQNGDEYVGKMLTVRFQELTDTDIPRFPVGIAFRELYE